MFHRMFHCHLFLDQTEELVDLEALELEADVAQQERHLLIYAPQHECGNMGHNCACQTYTGQHYMGHNFIGCRR